jgi:hypothetical protein
LHAKQAALKERIRQLEAGLRSDAGRRSMLESQLNALLEDIRFREGMLAAVERDLLDVEAALKSRLMK